MKLANGFRHPLRIDAGFSPLRDPALMGPTPIVTYVFSAFGQAWAVRYPLLGLDLLAAALRRLADDPGSPFTHDVMREVYDHARYQTALAVSRVQAAHSRREEQH